MKKILLGSFYLLITLICPGVSEAKSHKHHNHGNAYGHSRHESVADNGTPVSGHRCPYSCQTAGIPKEHCRDWRNGNRCYVQDTSGRQGQSAPRVDNRATYSPGYGYASPPPPSVGEAVGRRVEDAIDRNLR